MAALCRPLRNSSILPVLFLSSLLSCTFTISAEELELYVSTAGKDTWSGRLAEPNAAGTDGPLATIGGARDRVRSTQAAAGNLPAPVTVLIREGVYRQAEPIVFTPGDSGTGACPITYRAYADEKPVISGGKPIRGWQPDKGAQSAKKCEGKLWRAKVPALENGGKWRFNQLFVNGQRRTRARVPDKGAFLRTDGPISKGNSRGFYFKEGDVKEWANLRDAIFVVYHSWETSIHHVRYLDMEARQVGFLEPAPWSMGHWERQQRYYVENVFEELDEPGEWYLNRTTSTLYYYPLQGENMQRAEVTAPVLSSTMVLFKGDGAKGEFLEHLNFVGISFLHTNSNLRRLRNPGQGEIYQPGLVMAAGLRHSSFKNCEIAHTGAHAIWMTAGCEDNVIQHCHLHDLGGGGVYIGGGWGRYEKPAARGNIIDNNFIHDGGYMFHGAHGVWIGRSSYNKVTHNEISNFDYSGISCGWSWGFQPSSAHHNNLDYNHIHHLSNGDGLSDMGAIYTLGISPGTTERYNHMHDVYSYAPVSHGSGIYPDEGSSEILIENNVVYRVRTCPLFQHYGKDNIVRNNILAFGGKGQLQRCREDRPCSYTAEGNIVYAGIQQMLGGVWKSGNWKVGRNVYWSTAGAPKFKDMDFATWKKKGNDASSIVADPLLVDPENGDFRLKPNSPALKLGFKPIDLTKTGLYGEPEWVNLPKKYPNRPLNEIPAPVVPPFIVHFDFESDTPGMEPLEGKTVKNSQQMLAVSADTAAGGTQSLKFVDAPGDKRSWTPHIYYRPTYTTGKLHLSWDMLNTKETPASFYVEVRQWDVRPYLVGPTVSVTPEGRVTASGKAVGNIPLGKWMHVQIDFALGPGSPKSYTLTLVVPGRQPIRMEVPYLSTSFEKVTWFGISSTSDAKTVFYLDNLKLGTADELAKPPKQRPKRRRRSRPAPDKPANDQMLMGHWKLDEGDGYIARDASGYRNDGEFWATWAKGDFGTAVYLDSAASTITVPGHPTLQFGTSDFSIELWICPTKLDIGGQDRRRRFMNKDHYPHTWWNLNLTTDGVPFLEMVDENKAGGTTRPGGTIPENAWTHLAIVVDRAHRQVRYYYNGQLDSARALPANFTGPLNVEGADLSIGSTWHPFIGLLDEVKIYKRALPESEIKADYEKEKANRTSADYKLVE